MKKRSVDSIAKKIFIDDIAEQSEYERQFWILSDKLWTKITYGVGIFILGYGVYQLLREFGDNIIRFLMM